MARRKLSTKTKSGRPDKEKALTIWEQEYVEVRPKFEPAPLPDTIPEDSVLRKEYSLEYLMKHPDVAEQYVREVERYFGPLPKIRINYRKQSHVKKKTTKPRKAATRRR